MKTIAYLRVSTDEQDNQNQKLSILEYAHSQNLKVDQFVSVNISSRKSTKERGIDGLLDQLEAGDRLIVNELSRLGRSVGQVIQIVDSLIKGGVSFVAVKENIVLNGKHDIQSKVMITMFGLFAEIERDLISERTKQGLISAKAKGKQLGRPKGSFRSRLDDREAEIGELLDKKVSKASIAKIVGVSRTTLFSFIKSRGLE